MPVEEHFDLNQLVMKYIYRIQCPLNEEEQSEVRRVASNAYGFSFITFMVAMVVFILTLSLRFRNAQFLFIATTLIGHLLIAFYFEHYMLRLSLIIQKRVTKTMPHARLAIFYSALRSGLLAGMITIFFESWHERIMTLNWNAAIVMTVATLVFYVARIKFLALRH